MYVPDIITETNYSNTVSDAINDILDGKENKAIMLAIRFLTVFGIAIGIGVTWIVFVVRSASENVNVDA